MIARQATAAEAGGIEVMAELRPYIRPSEAYERAFSARAEQLSKKELPKVILILTITVTLSVISMLCYCQ